MKRSPLLSVFLTVVIDLLGFGIVLPLLPRYADQHHAPPWMVGVLFASFSAMQFVFAPLWGRVSDRVGRRPVLLAGLLGSVGAYLLFAAAEATPWPLAVLLVSRIFAGIAGATISTASAYIADVTTPEQRGRGMALIGAAFGVGFTVGPVIGGLGYALSVYAPGLIAAGCSLGAFLFALRRLPEPERHEHHAHAALKGSAVKAALATPTVPLILLLAFLATTAFAMFESTLSLLTKRQFAMDTTANGWLFAWIGLSLIVAQGAIVRRLLPRLGEARMVSVGALLLSAGLVGVAWAPSTGWLYGMVPVVVLGFAFITPSLSSLISRRTSTSTQGEVLGLYQSGLALARIAGPLAGNLLQGRWLPLPCYVGSVGLALAFVLSLGLGRVSAGGGQVPGGGLSAA